MKTKKGKMQISDGGYDPSLPQQWINQHCSLNRYILGWFAPYRLLERFRIQPQSKLGKFLIFIFYIFVLLGFPIVLTIILDQWEIVSVQTWTIIAVVFGLVVGSSYSVYYRIGLNVCSIGKTVVDDKFFDKQIKWDKFWFNLLIGGTVGAIISASMLASLIYINQQSVGNVIPAGNLFVISIVTYQIGEIACYNLLMCFEARNFSGTEHSLFRFNPIKTVSLQKSISGYNQFGLVTSIFMTIFIICSTILLPDSAFLSNPVWLSIIFTVYTIIILAVIVPRYYVQQIIRNTKQRELNPLRKKLNNLFDRLMDLNEKEHQQLVRLIEIQEKISKASESSLPFEALGRLFGTLVLPTITFILAVLGEAYISTLLQQVFQ